MSQLGRLFIILAAMWLIQLGLAFRQAKIFEKDLKGLRKLGTVATGMGGRRYRGGRAFVALAADDAGIVKTGLVLKGFTTFTNSKPITQYTGFSLDEIISGNRVASNVPTKVSEAAVMAAQAIKEHFKKIETGES